MICTACQTFLSTQVSATPDGEDSTRRETTPHHSLRRSIDKGCYACTRLWEALNPQQQTFVLDSSYSKSESGSGEAIAELGSHNIPITASSFLDGHIYGYETGHYLWEIGFRDGVQDAENQSHKPLWTWRASFVVQPFDDST